VSRWAVRVLRIPWLEPAAVSICPPLRVFIADKAACVGVPVAYVSRLLPAGCNVTVGQHEQASGEGKSLDGWQLSPGRVPHLAR